MIGNKKDKNRSKKIKGSKHLPYGTKDIKRANDIDSGIVVWERGTIKQKVKKEIENQLEDC